METASRDSGVAKAAWPPAPSSAWVARVAEWVGESPRPEARDLARVLHRIARRLEPGARHEPPPSERWLNTLADWVAVDERPQATRLARQLREWATGWMSSQAAADYLGVPLRTLYRRVVAGEVRAYAFWRVIRLKQDDLDAFIEASKLQRGSLADLYPEPRDADGSQGVIQVQAET